MYYTGKHTINVNALHSHKRFERTKPLGLRFFGGEAVLKSPITVYKLIILYMLDRIDEPISNSTISDFLLTQNLTNNYISVQQSISELDESDLISMETMGSRTMLRITRSGEDTLNFFVNELNPDIRNDCEDYLKTNGMELRAEGETTARYYKKTTGEYEVNMEVNENRSPVIGLKMSVPTEDMAKRMADRWLMKNEEIYRLLMGELLK